MFGPFPQWLDAFLIAPFQVVPSPFLGIWLGCLVLAAYCVICGEMTSALLFLANKNYYVQQQDAMVKAHNLSVEALHRGDKPSYLAVNEQAHELFGKAFFAQAAVGMAGLWPVPFALAWLGGRFEGIPIHTIPWWERPVGYPFVLLVCYILLRFLFARYKKHLPLFRYVHSIQESAKKTRGELRSFFNK